MNFKSRPSFVTKRYAKGITSKYVVDMPTITGYLTSFTTFKEFIKISFATRIGSWNICKNSKTVTILIICELSVKILTRYLPKIATIRLIAPAIRLIFFAFKTPKSLITSKSLFLYKSPMMRLPVTPAATPIENIKEVMVVVYIMEDTAMVPRLAIIAVMIVWLKL